MKKIKTFNVTRDTYDKIWYIICPECGEYLQYVGRDRGTCKCKCGYYWHVTYAAIGEKEDDQQADLQGEPV